MLVILLKKKPDNMFIVYPSFGSPDALPFMQVALLSKIKIAILYTCSYKNVLLQNMNKYVQ